MGMAAIRTLTTEHAESDRMPAFLADNVWRLGEEKAATRQTKPRLPAHGRRHNGQ
jgi:hypothetical protein